MLEQNLEIVLRLVVACVLGCFIGMERERRIWTAGMRTHMLVCMGAALFMLVSLFGFSDVLGEPGVLLDPSRVASQVATGIGFLCAGTIIFRRDAVRGLTTAASLWVVAAIGLAAGGGLYLAAAATTLLSLIILAVLKPLERRLFVDRRPQNLLVVAKRAETSLVAIESALRNANVDVSYIQWRVGSGGEEGDPDDAFYQVEIGFNRMRGPDLSQVMDTLRTVPGISTMSRNR
jgi:putative Mg2+ transporter-C (MgtC) family protein